MFFRRGLLSALLLAASLHAQNPAPGASSAATTFKAKVQVVLVDLVVTDAKGETVSALKQDDFAVLEDGKPQKISFFEEHTGSPLTQVKLPPLPANVFTNYSTIKSADAVNVLLLDWLNTQPSEQAFVHAQVVKYIKSAPPGRQLAIFTMGTRLRMIQGFTTDSAELLATLEKKGADDLHVSPLLASDAEKREEASSIALMRMNQASGAAIAARQEMQENNEFRNTDTRVLLTLQQLRQLARYLGGIPGRKNVIWFAGSFPIGIFPGVGTPREYEREIQENANLLNASRVAIYPVSTPGLLADHTYAADDAPTRRFQAASLRQEGEVRTSNQDAMEELARDSGGQAFVNTNGLTEAIAHAIGDGEHYYTLTYTPTNKSENGKYRRIEVKVSGKYQLSYRRGYYAEDARRTAEGATQNGDPLLPLLEYGLPDSSQIVYTVRVQPANPQPPAGAPRAGSNPELKAPLTRYRAEFAIAEKDLRLDLSPDGSRHGDIEMMMVAYDRDGKPLNLVVHQAAISLNAQDYQQFEKVGLQFRSEIDVPDGDAILRTGIFDLDSNLAGTLLVPLRPLAQP